MLCRPYKAAAAAAQLGMGWPRTLSWPPPEPGAGEATGRQRSARLCPGPVRSGNVTGALARTHRLGRGARQHLCAWGFHLRPPKSPSRFLPGSRPGLAWPRWVVASLSRASQAWMLLEARAAWLLPLWPGCGAELYGYERARLSSASASAHPGRLRGPPTSLHPLPSPMRSHQEPPQGAA